MNAHGTKKHYDPDQVGNFLRIGIYSHNDVEEEEAREYEMNIHNQMATVTLHQRSKKWRHVKQEERAIKYRKCN